MMEIVAKRALGLRDGNRVSGGRKPACLCGVVVLGGVFLLSGCKSAFVDADVKNQTGGSVTLVEVDYPSASFGKEALPAGAEFHQRFKILGSGGTTVMWTDAARVQHTVKGPELHEGQDGKVVIVLNEKSADWTLELAH